MIGAHAMKTRQVTTLLRTNYLALAYLIRRGTIPPPTKDASGDYVWGQDDIERARAALRDIRERRQRRQEPAAGRK